MNTFCLNHTDITLTNPKIKERTKFSFIVDFIVMTKTSEQKADCRLSNKTQTNKRLKKKKKKKKKKKEEHFVLSDRH